MTPPRGTAETSLMGAAAAFSAPPSIEPPRVAAATELFGGVSAEALAARARAANANFIVARVLQLSELVFASLAT